MSTEAMPLPARSVSDALRRHWPEYLMEAAGLGAFMVSACGFTALLFHPASPVSGIFENQYLARLPMGLAMGLTLIAIIFSPIGKQSGAHLNPATTLMFWRLGKISGYDAVWYALAQFAGGIAGVLLSALLLRGLIAAPSVNYAVTTPGQTSVAVAFTAEVLMTFALMTVVLNVSNTPRLSRYTGIFAACLVATYITLEAPLSGMSMNPARTLGSGLPAQVFDGLWIYFTAPPLGMLAAAEVYTRLQRGRVYCAKYHHHNGKRCIFRCQFKELLQQQETV
jgi:aquaporin Z